MQIESKIQKLFSKNFQIKENNKNFFEKIDNPQDFIIKMRRQTPILSNYEKQDEITQQKQEKFENYLQIKKENFKLVNNHLKNDEPIIIQQFSVRNSQPKILAQNQKKRFHSPTQSRPIYYNSQNEQKQESLNNIILPKHRKQNSLQNADEQEDKHSPNRFFKKPCIVMSKQIPADFHIKQTRTDSIKSNSYRTSSNGSENGSDQKLKGINSDYLNIIKQRMIQNMKKEKQPPNQNELITIKQQGLSRKSFSALNLKIYQIKEYPLKNIQQINNLKQYLNNFQKLNTQSPIVPLIDVLWNTPEGYLSLVTEYHPGQSLSNILKNTFSLPELFLHKMIIGIVKALKILQIELRQAYNGLDMNSVFIGVDNQIRLQTGVESLYFQSDLDKKGFYNYYDILLVSEQDSYNKDTLDLGYLILQCIFGNFLQIKSNFKQQKLNEKLLISSQNLKKSQLNETKYCCFIHQIKKQKDSSNMLDFLVCKENQFIMQQILNQYSQNFIDFLCGCLNFDPVKRLNIQQMQEHPFFNQPHNCKGPILYLDEITQVQGQKIMIQNYSVSITEVDRICNALKIILPNSEQFQELQNNWKKETNFNDGHPLVKDISQQFDIDPRYKKFIKL